MTKRVEFLREEIFKNKPSICMERARLWTHYHKRLADKKDPTVIRQAKAISYVLNNLTPKIYPDELLVGSFATKRISAIVYPELAGIQIIGEIFSIDKRKVNPLKISNKEKLELSLSIFPYWFRRTVFARGLKNVKSLKTLTLMSTPGVFILTESAGISHLTPNYEIIIKRGVRSIIDEAEERMRKTNSKSKKEFYEAVKISGEGLISFAKRYRDEAKRLAKNETGRRKKELMEIAEILDKVPEEPASNFKEALQSFWITHIAIFQENYEQAISPGRLDQMLYPFYIKDKEEGRINDEEVKELLGCLWIKSSEIVPLFSKFFTRFFGGYLVGQGLTVGGLNENGEDATNELSYIFLDVADEVRTRQPNFFVRISSKTKKEFSKRSIEVIKSGGGMPALFNDDIIIPSLINRGVSLKDALNYSIVGCVEQASSGNTFGSTDAALMNLPLCLEMALFEGKTNIHKRRIGVKTKPANKFSKFDDVISAFKTQVEYVVKNMVEGLAVFENSHTLYHPIPLLSILVEGTLEKGCDVTQGGAKYNFSGVQAVGLADAGDSLIAIKRLVFEDKVIDMDLLLSALRKNFKGYEKLRAEILNKIPKFGNDNDEVDKLTRIAQEIYCDEVEKYKNTRGGKFHPGFYSTTCHQAYGYYTGALPSGRLKREPFANGLSPCDGMDKLGPTATLNSVNKLNFLLISNGCAFNQKFDLNVLKDEKGTELLLALIETFFKKGGMQMQINILDVNELLSAKRNPEKYPNLMVRVAGYSAYFVDLSPEMQDEIIKRTLQGI